MPEAFRKGKGQRFSMYGYATPTLILIETWTSSRYTSSTRMTRRDCRSLILQEWRLINYHHHHHTQRVIDVEQGTFTPLVFTTTGGIGEGCKRYHIRLAELIAAKKGEEYANTVFWIRSKVSFAILRSALLCLRGSRTPKRTIRSNVQEADFELDRCLAKIYRSYNFYTYIPI